MDYPSGFAQRFLMRLVDFGPAWANMDLQTGRIDLVSEDDDGRTNANDEDAPVSARIIVNDAGIQPHWLGLVEEATVFYPRMPVEEGVISMLATIIDEYTATGYTPPPRLFNVSQILSGNPPKHGLFGPGR